MGVAGVSCITDQNSQELRCLPGLLEEARGDAGPFIAFSVRPTYVVRSELSHQSSTEEPQCAGFAP
jgi:hypothetical protein